MDVRIILPPRWSWLHWWEANRERYLFAPSQAGPGQGADAPRLQAMRDEAAAELLAIVQNARHERLVTEAVIALGKMRHVPALPGLKALVERSESARVRTAALAAMGLIGTPAAETDLIALNAASRTDRVGQAAAVGLLSNIQTSSLESLRKAVTVDDPAVATVACWSLRQHHHADNLEYYRGLLRQNKSPWVASEALLALGQTEDLAAVRLLEGVLLGHSTAGADVRAWDELRRLADRKPHPMAAGGDPRGSYDRAYDDYRKAHDEFYKDDPNRPTAAAKGTVRTVTIEVGREEIQLAWLRTSAAIALGQIDLPQAGEPLLNFVEMRPDDDPYLLAPKGFAIMALAAHPSDRSRDRLIALLGKEDRNGRLQTEATRDSAVRGYAALALGLYARPYLTEQGLADRPGYEWAIVTLAERLQDEREDLEVRSAAAVGLGLTQRTAVLPALYRVTEATQARGTRGVALYGYLLMARAMVGDQNVLDPAGQFLLRREDDMSTTGILTRRAAVLSLGLMRSSTAIPVLTQAWHLNHYVNREVIISLRLAGATNAGPVILGQLRKAAKDDERAYMAQVLGELLAPEQPTPLNRLIADSNFTVRNDNLLPLQRLANGFLFDFLIPSFGELW